MASIYTGLTERSHRCSRYNDFSQGLDPEVPTLPVLLQEQGYSTAAAVNTGYLGETFRMKKGYDFFWLNEDGSDNADITVDSLLEFFTSNKIQEPFLATIHLFDPHIPYDPPAPFDTLFKRSGTGGITEWPEINYSIDPVIIEHMTAMYDSEIRWTDYQLSRLFREMDERGLLDNTLIVLIADHGEEFMEHGDWGHAHNLYQQVLESNKVIWFIEPDSTETFNLADDREEMNLLPTDTLLLEEVMNYWAWPCICSPTRNEIYQIEMKRLEGLGYIR